MSNYILDEHGVPVVEPDILKWARWFEEHKRHVAETFVGDVRISTVFLGIDHKFGLRGGRTGAVGDDDLRRRPRRVPGPLHLGRGRARRTRSRSGKGAGRA